MKQTFLPKTSEAVRTNIRHRRWQHALLAMAAVVVFVTVYMLILPAITMTSETSCGLAEHTHTEACYELRLVCGQEETPEGTEAHVHGPECYETQSALTCEQEESAGHTHSEACYGYTCGQEESEGHAHTDACYTVTSELTCTVAEGDGGHAHSDGCYDETGALVCGMSEGDGGHVHSDACYTETSQLTCGQEESAGHTHSEACTGLICGQEESEGHTHTDTCYTEEQVLVCTQSEGHTHTDACYEQVLICEIPEHTHTDACYETEIGDEDVPLSEFLCGMEEHTHMDACYGEDGSLTCTLPEHTHDESCLPQEETDFICGMEEHTHTDACYGEDGSLACTLPEHTHDESCLPQEETDFICGMEEHTHTDACYDADGNLTCTLPEHTHDESCLPEETDPNAFPEELPEGYREYTYQNEEGLSVLVYAPENAFAEDVTLYAEQLAEDSEAYAQAQADLDAAENVAEYDGMAALDVRFENAGGAEVEPDASAGPVYVKIDVEALLPEDVDESTVAVQHHAEVSDGGIFGTGIFAGTEVAVETVADASADTGEVTLTPSAVTLTEDPVPAAENALTEEDSDAQALTEETAQPAARLDVEASFAVESFSTFTITWNNGEYSRPVSVYLNDTEVSLEELAVADVEIASTVTISSSTWLKIEDLLIDSYYNRLMPHQITYNGKTYTYDHAGDTAGNTIVWVRALSDGSWLRSNNNSYDQPNGDTANNSTTFAFPAGEPLRLYYYTASASQIDGSDTSQTIEISLFDYTNKNQDSSLSKNNVNGNRNSMSLLFSGADGTYNGGTISDSTSSSWWNYWTGKNGGVIQGIVQPELGEDGNPVLAVGDKNSLNYLYSESYYAKAYTDLNKLFRYDSSTGYYSFDSSLNFATINPDGNGSYDKNFTLYDKPNTGTSSGSTGHPYFIPFNDYGTNESGANYHFGMKITAEFAMPKDGQVNGSDMIFSFTGDDDVWVYIDGVLILDMGGIHDSCSGSINFAEGTVTANKVYGIINESGNSIDRTENQSETAYIGDLLYTAYKDNQKYIDANLELRNDGHWYLKDYMSHNFSFFYLERGAVDSNCQIEFNLYTLQRNSLNVSKTLDTYTSEGEADNDAIENYLSNLEYTFRVLKADADPSTTNPDDLFITSGTTYQIYKDGVSTGKTGTVGADGTFTIKAGETAVFANITENSGNYYVQEIVRGEYEEQFGDVTVSVAPDGGTSYGESNGVILDGEEFVGVISGNLSSENTGFVNFTNKVDIEQLSVLEITKAAVAGSQFGDQSFDVQVTLGGEPIAAETPYMLYSEEYPDGNRRTVAEIGVIQLKPGETAAFLVLTGTEYTVREVNGNTYHVGYSATQKIGGSTWTSDGGGYTLTVTNPADGDPTASGVVGEIIGDITDATNATVEVTVTNSSYDFNTSLDLSKTLTGYSGDSYKFDFTVTQVDEDGRLVTEDTTGTPVGTTITIDSTDSETGTIYFGFKNTDEAGIYYYKVSEDIPESITDGVSYDTSYYIVTVQVSESGGSKTASVTGVTKYSEGDTMDEDFEWTIDTPIPFTNALGGDLSITKVVEYTGNSDYVSKEVFAFTVGVDSTSGKTYTISYTYPAGKTQADYTWPDGVTQPNTVTFDSNNQTTVYIPAGATVTIQDLPATAHAVITETNTDGYSAKWTNTTNGSSSGGSIAATSGATVTTTKISNNPAVTCTNTTGAVLPSTGGPGVAHILTLGAMLALGAGALLLLQQRRKEGREP